MFRSYETGGARHGIRVGFALSLFFAVLAGSITPSLAQDSKPSNSEPVFVDGNTTMRRMHDETGARARVGAPVSATDADGDTLTYSLIGQDASSFSVDADGQISLGVAVAGSGRISYRFWVTVYDGKDSQGNVETTPVIDDIIFVTITVTTTQGERLPARDIGLSREVNSNPFGVWSDGETMWVADWVDDAVYAHDLSTGSRNPDKEFVLASANDSPFGIWSDGTTMWVADDNDLQIYAYTLSSGLRDSSKEFIVDGANDWPWSLWSDGVTMWVGDRADLKLYAYTLSSGVRDSSRDIELDPENARFYDLWSDGTTIWVPDRDEDKVFAYSLSTGERDLDSEFPLTEENSDPAGIWSDGETVWVADSIDGHAYAYALTSGASGTIEEFGLGSANEGHIELFGLAEDNDCPAGMWATDQTAWVVDWCHDRLFAYDSSSGLRQPGNDIELGPDSGDPAGVWSDGATAWIADPTEHKLFAYTMSTGARATDKDLILDPENTDATGLWSDGKTVWVADHSTDKLFAYSLSTGARVTDFDIVLDTQNTIAVGLWADGETMWVADIPEGHIFAYGLWTGARDVAKDIKLASDNSGVWGIWSDGTSMWALDRFDAKLYAYSVSVPEPGFTDVNPISYSFDYMELLYSKGIATGTSDTTYSPTDFATREQVAAMLARTYHELTGSRAAVVQTGFVDISSSFAADDIARIYGLGITTGTSATTYSPTDFVTREQAAAMLARMYAAVSGSPADAVLTGFVDISSSFAADDIARIYGLGITTGTSDTTFSPDEFATREQMAAFIGRLIRVL